MAGESWSCWPLSAWLSSGTACFLFFNAVVCVVAVLSWGRGGADATLSARCKRLTRSASSMVMERLRSMSTLFSFHSADEYDSITPLASQLQHVQGYYYASQQEGGEEMRQAASEVEPDPAVPVVESMTATMARPKPSAPVAVAEVCAAASTEEAETREEMSGNLEDASAVVARQALGPTPVMAAASERPRMWKVTGIVERRAFAEIEEKAEVNARAERFIRQFRQDLKLERLNSILNGKC